MVRLVQKAYRQSRLAKALTFVVLCLVVIGCRHKRPAGPSRPTAQEANEILATVNGVSITSRQVDPVVEQWMARFADRLAQWTPEYIEQRRRDKRRQVIDQMIAEYLLDQEVERQQISITNQQVDQAIVQMATQQQPPMSIEQFLVHVQNTGKTVSDLRAQISKQLARLALCDQITANVEVTDEQAVSYYKSHIDQFQEPEQVRASHILLRPDPKAPDPNQEIISLVVKARQLLAQVQAGADFAHLARAYSQCPSAKDGGDLGFFKRGEMEGPFEKLAFDLSPGQVGGPIQTSYGVHLIKVTDRRPGRQLTYDQAREKIIQTLTTQKRQEVLKEYIGSLRAKARIEHKVR